jgi:hypothetical protein
MRAQPHEEEGAGSMSADLDAYRRHRSETLPVSPGRDDLVDLMDAMKGSDQPQVVFARLADLAVTVLCDACDVEIDDGTRTRVHRSTQGPVAPLDGQEESVDAAPDGAATDLHVALAGPSREDHPSYVGIATFSWSTRRPSDAEELAATIAVRHAPSSAATSRLLNLLGAAEGRAAGAALSAITSRSINLAIGIGMHQHGETEGLSEDRLRQSAAESGQTLFSAAARAVRRRALPDRRPSDARTRGAGARTFPRRLEREAPGTDET